MKVLRRLLVLLFLSALPTLAQNGHVTDVAFQHLPGVPLYPAPGALITVCTSAGSGTPCGPLATIYGGPTNAVIATNPFNADINGNYAFWAAPGTYVVTITGPNVNAYTLTYTIGLQVGGAGLQVFTNQTSVYTAGLQNFSAVTMKLPQSPGFVSSLNSTIGIDTTSGMGHLFANGFDNIFGLFPASLVASINDNDCVKFTKSGGNVTLNTSGAACGVGNNSLPTLPTDALIRNLCEQGTGSASQPSFWCTPGLAPDVQTGVVTYTIPANDYGHYVMFVTEAAPIAVTLPQQTNFFSFLAINNAVGTATFTPQSGQIWTGGALAATLALTTGQAAFFESDNTNWTATLIATPGAGAGTVTHTGGALVAGQLVLGNAAADIAVGDLSGDCTTSGSAAVTCTKINGTAFPTSATVVGSDGSAKPIAATTTGSTTTVVLQTSPTLITPVLGVATGTSLLASGIVDGKAPVTITTSAACILGTAGGCDAVAYNSGYTFNEEAVLATAITYTLPTAAAGKQYCVGNAYNAGAETGTIEILTSAAGQFIIFTDGTLSATGGYVISGGAAADFACVVGVDATHWYFKPSSGVWTKH